MDTPGTPERRRVSRGCTREGTRLLSPVRMCSARSESKTHAVGRRDQEIHPAVSINIRNTSRVEGNAQVIHQGMRHAKIEGRVPCPGARDSTRSNAASDTANSSHESSATHSEQLIDDVPRWISPDHCHRSRNNMPRGRRSDPVHARCGRRYIQTKVMLAGREHQVLIQNATPKHVDHVDMDLFRLWEGHRHRDGSR